MQQILYYLFVINALSAGTAIWDKRCARRDAWRVPEKTLFALCVLGGGPMMYVTMRLIHHKTLHRRFMWGIPLIVLIEAAAVFLLWKFG